MSTRCRTDILRAYTYFSPASVDVIARIEHMEQMPDIEIYCTQLYEDGLLERVEEAPDGIVEFRLSPTGRGLVENKAEVLVPPTKYTIYNQLRAKERLNASVRRTLSEILRGEQGRFRCVLEIQSLFPSPISIPEMSSVLYGLLYTGQIVQCGSLYGILPQ